MRKLVLDNVVAGRRFAETLVPRPLSPLERRSLAAVWEPDASSSACRHCNVEFGVFTRRHHCRLCGRLSCADCSAHEASLPFRHDNPVRVCNALLAVHRRHGILQQTAEHVRRSRTSAAP